MTKLGKMLNDVSGRLAIMELACLSLAHKDLMACVFSVKRKNWCADDYNVELSNFLGETLELTMDCQVELDALEKTLQSSSEKKGA